MFRVRLADNINVVLATWVICSNKNMPLSGDEQRKSHAVQLYTRRSNLLRPCEATLLGQSGLDEAISLVNQGSHLDVSPNGHVDDSASPQDSERNVNLTTSRTNALESQLDVSGETVFQEPATPL